MLKLFRSPFRSKSALVQLKIDFRFLHRQSPLCRPLSTPTSVSKPPPPKAGSSEDEDEHAPKPLDRPIGQVKPPEPGENSGVDPRTWRQRRDDFFNYDKHLTRRKQLTSAVAKPYFRDWSNTRYHKGKTFWSNSKLFRGDRALYFPNLQGNTLASSRKIQDTTNVLQGKVSVVSLYSGTWAERQAATFVGQHSELGNLLRERKDILQRVDINYEDNALKAGLIRLFMSGLRRRFPAEQHGNYFLVRHGLKDEMRDALGCVNSKVGYVYLLDKECKIRWAGSAEAVTWEKEALARGTRRLVEEWKK